MISMENQRKRQTAHLVRLKDLINGTYVKEEGWEPNYINTINGRKISRVNIIGVIIDKVKDPEQNFSSIALDDKSGNIAVRSFENKDMFDGLHIGDIVLLVGRPREFGREKYIVPEIIRKVDVKWLELRMLEHQLIDKKNGVQEPDQGAEADPRASNNASHDNTEEKPQYDPVKEEKVVEDGEELPEQAEKTNKKGDDKDPFEIILSTIRRLDNGRGAEYDAIISTSKVGDAERILMRLLEEGEIFEVKPGFLKVLE